MRKKLYKIIAFTLSAAIISGGLFHDESMAAKKVKPALSSTKISLKIGKSRTVKIINAKTAKVKKVEWTLNKKAEKIITLKKKTNTSVQIKAQKKGSATVTAKIHTDKKCYTKNIKVIVKKKAESNKPNVTEEPIATKEPEIYGNVGETSVYDTVKANYTLGIDASDKVHDISELLYGIFIEDINFAADGGLYAEMIQNRSFEFTKLAAGNAKHAWNNVGDITAKVLKNDPIGCLNANNPNYMVLTNASSEEAGIENIGFLDGMYIKKNAKYKFSVYARGLDGYKGSIHVILKKGNKKAAEGTIKTISSEWKKYELTLTSGITSYSDVTLQVLIDKGKVAVDMVSLFPEDTFKNRSNGLRKDLAEKLEELNPAFVRFPGGCVVEGINLECAYSWKDSIGADSNGEPYKFNDTYGDVAARKQGQNIWTNEDTTSDQYPCFMTYGLGFYEYFLLAEDIGAIGLPVINCGKCCMIQPLTDKGAGPAIASEEFQRYIQDALDLVEFCKGDSTTKWGAVRSAMGHEEPFELKYVGIGNEQWGNDFFERYEAFVEAFEKAKEEKPEIYNGVELMFTSGADDGDSGTDYMAAYERAENWLLKNPDKTINDFAGVIDHHYYNDPDWFLTHADYYDEKNYARDVADMTTTKFGGGINVFLGEYAAKSNTLQAALAEAAYMTGLERNGDIVKMAAYAPLFGNITAIHWAPDLIWFNNHTVTASINYYMQKLFATNAGNALLKSELNGAEIADVPFKGKVGVGTWDTSAKFDNVEIVDNETGKILASDDFTTNNFNKNWQKISDGNWNVNDGMLVQSSVSTNISKYGNIGTVAYFGTNTWSNYTYTVDAVKTGGNEGFLIPFAVGNSENNYFWNIGGWGNTVSCLQQVDNGSKSGQLAGTIKDCCLETGITYKIKVIVTDDNVKCYLNDTLYVDYNLPKTANAESYQVVSTDDSGDIIVKLVNVTGYAKTFAIDIAGTDTISDVAEVETAAGDSLKNDNILGQKEAVTIVKSEITGVAKQFNYTVPQYSATVLRIKKK